MVNKACIATLQFEKSNNKAAIVGWTAAGVGAFFVTEWLLHLPLLDVVRYALCCEHHVNRNLIEWACASAHQTVHSSMLSTVSI